MAIKQEGLEAHLLKFFNGVVEIVTEQELMDWKAYIDKIGISICPNSAVAVAGTMKLNKAKIITETDNVVIIIAIHVFLSGLSFKKKKLITAESIGAKAIIINVFATLVLFIDITKKIFVIEKITA